MEVVEPPVIPKATPRNLFCNRWSGRWQQLNSCRQTKIWISTLGIMGKEVNLLGHATLSTVIQALTGHNYLNYHCSKVDKFPTENCRCCREERKEFVHLARKCLTLARERWLVYQVCRKSADGFFC